MPTGGTIHVATNLEFLGPRVIEGSVAFVQKPFTGEQLATQIRRVLARAARRRER